MRLSWKLKCLMRDLRRKLAIFEAFWLIIIYCCYLAYRTLHHWRSPKLRRLKDVIVFNRIVYRMKLIQQEPTNIRDFIGADATLQNMEVLRDPHWCLYTVSRKQLKAVFVRMPEPLTHYISTVAPILCETQFYEAEKVAICTLDTFIYFAQCIESARDESPRIIYLSSTARSGTTLVARLLQTDNVISISEPGGFIALATLIDTGRWSKDDQRAKDVLSALLTMFTKNSKSGETYVIKTQSQCNVLLPIFLENHPEVLHMFHYRRSVKMSIRECVRACHGHAIDANILPFSPSLWRLLRRTIMCAVEAESVEKCRVRTLRDLATVYYLAPFERLLAQQHQYPNTNIVFSVYEDLMEFTEDLLEKLFDDLQLKCTDIIENLEWMFIDSQAGTSLSQKRLRRISMRQRKKDLSFDIERHHLQLVKIVKILNISDLVVDEEIRSSKLHPPLSLSLKRRKFTL